MERRPRMFPSHLPVQSKGRERRLVVVNSFDASYLKYHARSARKDICPNALYVGAATRATRATSLPHSCGGIAARDRTGIAARCTSAMSPLYQS